jgi:hypothetical protein
MTSQAFLLPASFLHAHTNTHTHTHKHKHKHKHTQTHTHTHTQTNKHKHTHTHTHTHKHSYIHALPEGAGECRSTAREPCPSRQGPAQQQRHVCHRLHRIEPAAPTPPQSLRGRRPRSKQHVVGIVLILCGATPPPPHSTPQGRRRSLLEASCASSLNVCVMSNPCEYVRF